eukprot:TRINITY_DN5886_c0_g1_i1.p1 TRINITY_DN5886_c0_g1~~TRINITY_DN5886_c0_g1_i1.p1  ORF type:complete len:446 (+),score=44.93 TRINITY_DN5886_c0_g1_i1:264-1601(+)
MLKGISVLFCFVLLYLRVSVVEGVVIVGDRNYTTATTPFWSDELGDFRVKDFVIHAPLVAFEETLPTSSYRNAIVIMDYGYGLDSIAKQLESYGTLGIIMRIPQLGSGGFGLDDPRSDYFFPCLEILQEGYDDIVSILASDSSLTVTIISDKVDDAFFQKYEDMGKVLNIVFGTFFVVIVLFVMFKVGFDIRANGYSCTLRFVIAWVIFLLNTSRLVYLIYDPFTYYRAISWRVMGVYLCVHLVFSMFSTVVVTIYWFEYFNKGLVRIPGLNTARIPYYIILGIYTVSCIAISCVVIFVPNSNSLVNFYFTIFLPLMSLTVIAMAIFQFITACSVLNSEHLKRSGTKRKNSLSTFLKKILAASVMQIIFIPMLLAYLMTFNVVISSIQILIYFILCGAESLIVFSLIHWGESNSNNSTATRKTRNDVDGENTSLCNVFCPYFDNT